jgi:hypothetical protein
VTHPCTANTAAVPRRARRTSGAGAARSGVDVAVAITVRDYPAPVRRSGTARASRTFQARAAARGDTLRSGEGDQEEDYMTDHSTFDVDTFLAATDLNSDHRDVVRRLFAVPPSENIEWRQVRSLLEALGAVTVDTTASSRSSSGDRSRCLRLHGARTSTAR